MELRYGITAGLVELLPDLVAPLDTGLLVLFAEALHPGFGGDLIAGSFQAVVDADHITLVDVAGAGAALNGVGSASTVERQFGTFGKRQNAVFVFQKDETFLGGFFAVLRWAAS